MTLVKGQIEINTFVGGFNTEASKLVFPQNTATDLKNVDINIDGSVQRRLGVDYETSYVLSTSTVTDSNLETYAIHQGIWNSPGGKANLNFLVIQIGNILHFYENTTVIVSTAKKSFTVDLDTHLAPAAAGASTVRCEFDSGRGDLYVVSNKIVPLRITYDPATDTITENNIALRIRDFDGIDDGLDLEEEPSTLSNPHSYNLENQGWRNSKVDQVNEYLSDTGNYPANNMIWYLEKDSDGNTAGTRLRRFPFGNTPAPKGHFILDPFNKDRSTVSGISGIAIETIDERPDGVSFFSGRVCYAQGNDVYISQTLNKSRDNAGVCHQEADPTSEEISDLVDTDGVVVNIPEASGIRKLVVRGASLVVLADNGVWKISGVDGVFKATEFSVDKLSDNGMLSPASVVAVGSTPYWLSDTGIFRIGRDQSGISDVVENLTETTIKSAYTSVGSNVWENSNAVYDKVNEKIYWFYKDNTDAPANSSPYYYNRTLIFDLRLNAFTGKHVIGSYTDSPFIVGAFVSATIGETDETFQVVVGSDNIIAGSGNDVKVTQQVRNANDPSFKMICIEPNKSTTANNWTFAEFKDIGFTDWLIADTVNSKGADYESLVDTGYELAGSTAHFKQTPYVVVHSKRTETGFVDNGSGEFIFVRPSSLLLQARWDWTDNGASGKIGSQQQVYRFRRQWIVDPSTLDFENGFPVTTTRSKLRGRGKALQLRFVSETGKDFDLIGYHLTVVGGDRL